MLILPTQFEANSAMNPDEDEDAFLYGDDPQQSAAPLGRSSLVAEKPVDQQMEQSEGEVEDEEEDEEESDSVCHAR